MRPEEKIKVLDTMKDAVLRKALRAGWGEWLGSYPWDHYATLTFRQVTGPDLARESFDRWMRRLAREAQLPLFWFLGIEDGRLNGRLHIHALIGNTGHHSIERMDERWTTTPDGKPSKRNGFTRIVRYDPTLGAAHYCTKYVTKELHDYDVSDNFTQALAARSKQLWLSPEPVTPVGSPEDGPVGNSPGRFPGVFPGVFPGTSAAGTDAREVRGVPCAEQAPANIPAKNPADTPAKNPEVGSR